MKSTDAGYSQLTIPQPFASASGAALTPISNTSSAETPSFPDGFPAVFSSPSSDANAKFILRGMMNAIGNLASKNEWYRQAGGIYTFNSAWATANGGYPNRAILDYLKDGHYYKVMSLKDDNMVDFTDVGVDGINWLYLNIDTSIDYSKLSICDIPNFAWPYADVTQTGEATVMWSTNDTFPIGLFKAPRDGVITISGSCTFEVSPLKWVSTDSTTTPPTTVLKDSYLGTGFGIVVCSDKDTDERILGPFEAQGATIYTRGDFYEIATAEEQGTTINLSYYYREQKPLVVTQGTDYQIYVINKGATIKDSTMKVVLL